MQQNTVKQTENFGEVVGLLKDKKIKFGISNKTGKNFANGYIEVEVANEYGTNVIKIDVMQMELKANGEENKNYKALQTIDREYKTIIEYGAEQADLVQVFIKIEENNYYSKDQQEVKEGIKLLASTNFDKQVFAPIKRIEDKNTKHKAQVSFEGMITDIQENEETKELKVSVVGATYKGEALKHKLDVSSELAADFRRIYWNGCVATFHYLIVNAVEKKQIQNELAFGNVELYYTEKLTRKNLLVGGSNIKSDSDLTQEKVVEMLGLRQSKLERVKEEALSKEESGVFGQNPFATSTEGNISMKIDNPFALN